METLGQLKLDLMAQGVGLADDTRDHPEIARALASGNAGEEIAFALTQDFFVRAPVHAPSEGLPVLKAQREKITLNTADGAFEVSVFGTPRFLEEKRKAGRPGAADISLDGYCLNLFFRAGPQEQESNLASETVVRVVRSAFEEGVADLVQMNMDFCPDPDRGFRHLSPMVQLVKKNFRTFVALRGFPPAGLEMIDTIYAAGVDLLVLPLEGFAACEEATIPAELGPKALEYAAGVFPPGSVSTELGLKAPGLLQDITRLCEKGIIPLLKLPEDGLPGSGDYEPVRAAAKHLALSAQRYKLNLKWLYPSCRLITPLDASFYTEPPETARLAMRPVYQSTLGKTASEGFAALRRKLRVKNISDSYESAGL